MNWWENPEIKKMYAVGQAFTGKAQDGQKDGWMLEGLFETEQEAIDHCTVDEYAVFPLPVGIMTGMALPDGMFWPRLQSKEEGQERLEKFRQGVVLD